MSCEKKKHEKHEEKREERGERGKRGHRGHHGPIGFPGPTGPIGPCCTGATGAPGTAPACESLFARITDRAATTSPFFTGGDLLCLCFTLANDSDVNMTASLSALVLAAAGQPPLGNVYYRLFLNGTPPIGPLPGSGAGSQSDEESGELAGNAIVYQTFLSAGDYCLCIQWRIGAQGQSAEINPAVDGQHASLLVESCGGITFTPP